MHLKVLIADIGKGVWRPWLRFFNRNIDGASVCGRTAQVAAPTGPNTQTAGEEEDRQ